MNDQHKCTFLNAVLVEELTSTLLLTQSVNIYAANTFQNTFLLILNINITIHLSLENSTRCSEDNEGSTRCD